MRHKLLWIIVALSAGYLLLTRATDLRSYRHLPQLELERLQTQQTIEIDNIVRTYGDNLKDDEVKQHYYQLRGERSKIAAELLMRHYMLDTLMIMLLTFSGVLLGFRLWYSQCRKSQKQQRLDVQQLPAREEYLDPWALTQRLEHGFADRESAIQFLRNDPSLVCDYCHGRMQARDSGKGEAIQLVTFYKTVPEGSKDMRLVLGSAWFVQYASHLRCAQCGKETQR